MHFLSEIFLYWKSTFPCNLYFLILLLTFRFWHFTACQIYDLVCFHFTNLILYSVWYQNIILLQSTWTLCCIFLYLWYPPPPSRLATLSTIMHAFLIFFHCHMYMLNALDNSQTQWWLFPLHILLGSMEPPLKWQQDTKIRQTSSKSWKMFSRYVFARILHEKLYLLRNFSHNIL